MCYFPSLSSDRGEKIFVLVPMLRANLHGRHFDLEEELVEQYVAAILWCHTPDDAVVSPAQNALRDPCVELQIDEGIPPKSGSKRKRKNDECCSLQ